MSSVRFECEGPVAIVRIDRPRVRNAVDGCETVFHLGALIAIPVAASVLLIINQVVVPRQNEL